jgi:cell division protein FtsI (penicillin-binding protein 3)
MIRRSRIGFAHALLALFALTVIGRAALVQLYQGSTWRARAERQQLAPKEVPAPRGQILDAAGLVLAQSREMLQLEIAPREIRSSERAALRRALLAARVKPDWVARAMDAQRTWVTLPGRFLAADIAPAARLRGVHVTPASVRTYAMSEGTRRLVGRVDAQNRPLDGLELTLDSLLRGTAGSATLVRDIRGRSFETPTAPRVIAKPGSTIVLTLNHDLQEIAEHALGDAVGQMGAEGGDIVILDPHTGDILAMASRRSDVRSTAATALTEPFEPGSTLKPFIAAGLLARGRARETDMVNTGDGTLELEGRVIRDEHLVGRASLASVLQWSSNVGIVKFAQRLAPREQFEVLRDFGFGTPTGVPYPSEAAGVLREPARWSKQSGASLAMGYEISVTPLQLALAYAAIANGGELLEPALVKEVRSPEGEARYRHERRVVRRVLTPELAARIRTMLLNVVERGTAVEADLDQFLIAGKTGTPRRNVDGRYAAQQYNPNFVGMFPGDAPQYVIVVKLTNPRDERGRYYGGSTAAPLTKTILQAAIAARDAALDREKLAVSARAAAAARPDSASVASNELALHQQNGAPRQSDSAIPPRALHVRAEPAPVSTIHIISLSQSRATAANRGDPRPVPDVRGLDLREAVYALHGAGFRVQLVRGANGETAPSAGAVTAPGSLVRLSYNF